MRMRALGGVFGRYADARVMRSVRGADVGDGGTRAFSLRLRRSTRWGPGDTSRTGCRWALTARGSFCRAWWCGA
eukprot:3428271-Rhodomonas_salina.4